ncbi:MAG TPA: hypothetical protein VFW98_03430 [Gemmatimonadaceae bacterium]|nr:hypothetical protein [Gemmatimonadaceae bacterium]
MHLMMLVPDGTGLRTFLSTRFMAAASEHALTIWHALPPESIAEHEARWRDGSVQWERLPEFRDGVLPRLLRQAKVFSQLYGAEHEGARVLLSMWRPPPRRAAALLEHSARALGRMCAGTRGTVRLDALHARAVLHGGVCTPYRDFLVRQRPDVVFCTHQRAVTAVPALLAARALGIPTATFIYSWDNVPKGRMVVHADHVLVWSNHMRDELLRYYADMTPERVHVIGTPQFEPYFDQSIALPREQFLRQHGLSAERPVVCFSGDDRTTSPHDPELLADLARAMRAIPEPRRPQLLFRRCPVDQSDRYDAVLRAYPEIAVSEPAWLRASKGEWTQVVPTSADSTLLANIVRHADAVVNVGSTMAMDFALLGKPAVYLAYNPPSATTWDVDAVYRLEHFRVVHELQPVYWARSADDVGSVVMHALDHPDEKQAARQAWLDRIVAQPFTEASERCLRTLRRLAREAPASCTSPS